MEFAVGRFGGVAEGIRIESDPTFPKVRAESDLTWRSSDLGCAQTPVGLLGPGSDSCRSEVRIQRSEIQGVRRSDLGPPEVRGPPGLLRPEGLLRIY